MDFLLEFNLQDSNVKNIRTNIMELLMNDNLL